MEKAPMDKLLLSNIHIVLLGALLLLIQGKGFVESSSSSHENDTATGCIADERSALIGFKAGLSDPGNLLSSWTGDDCCKWEGVICSSRNNHVIELDLSGHRCDSSDDAMTQVLGGKISSSVLGLRHLQYLDLSCNGFYGVQVPEFLGSLHKLTYIDLSESSFIGRIPPQLGNLSNLQYLNLAYGAGTYSKDITWLSKLTSLEHLDLSNVSLSTTVHWLPVVNMLPSLKVLRLSNCDLRTSSASLQLPNLTSLETLDLSQNNLVGPLPLDFGAPSLELLILSDNSISGTIPFSLCKLRSLLLLDISANKLTGSIPDCSADTSIKNRTSMRIRILNLRNNSLSGEFPSFLRDCQQIVLLDLEHNHFSGTLPTWIGEKLPNLAFLRLRSNMLYGDIPEELMALIHLQYLDLACNNLTGSIPKSVFNYKGMMLALKDYDEFNGALRYARNIGLYTGNSMVLPKGKHRLYTGEITYLVNFDLSCNSLIGDIPEEVSYLVELMNLNLSWNTFTGKIPENIGSLAIVESLNLSHNELSGEIPSGLSGLMFLSSLNLSYNKLIGEIPSGNQLQTLDNPEYIYIGNPGLCGPPLSQKCSQPEPIPFPATREHHKDLKDEVSFFIGMGSGYVMGLWVVLCAFLFKRKWIIKWYTVCDGWYDWVYVQVAVTWASWTRETIAEAESDN